MNRFLSIFFVLTLVISSSVEAKSQIPPKLQSFIKKIESQKRKLQGGAIAILYKGNVIYKTTFGYQKGHTGRITSKTLFPLASVSKTVSATAIGLMADQKRINLDQKVKISYLEHPVSLKDILSHTTGYKFSGNRQIEHGLSRPKALKELEKQEPECKPAQCYSYSNINFSLAEEALNAQKLTLQDTIRNLRKVLKTDEIQMVPVDSKLSIAYPHTKKKTKKGVTTVTPLPFPPYYPTTAPAAAGIFASLDGMIEIFKLSFGYRPDLMSKKAVDLMHTPVLSNKDIGKWGSLKWPLSLSKIESSYGLGCRIVRIKEQPEKEFIFHGGYISGIRTFMGFIPSEDMGIIVLTNQDTRMASQDGIDFWGVFLK